MEVIQFRWPRVFVGFRYGLRVCCLGLLRLPQNKGECCFFFGVKLGLGWKTFKIIVGIGFSLPGASISWHLHMHMGFHACQRTVQAQLKRPACFHKDGAPKQLHSDL